MSAFSTEVFDSEVVPSSLSSIAPILRVAKEIEHERPRVAYLCRFYAFEKANRLDASSTGQGVRQFKTSLLQRLEWDNASSLASRTKRTDAREIESFYQQYYEQYVRSLELGHQADRAQLGKVYQTAGSLFEVLCAVNKTEKVDESEVFDNEVVPSSLFSIAPILRVANEIELERPRVAYLCRFYAVEKAHRLDANATGRGVRQFKTALLQRLEKDNAPSLAARTKRTDAREIESFYDQYYDQHVRSADKGDHQADRAQLRRAFETAGTLFEVLFFFKEDRKS